MGHDTTEKQEREQPSRSNRDEDRCANDARAIERSSEPSCPAVLEDFQKRDVFSRVVHGP